MYIVVEPVVSATSLFVLFLMVTAFITHLPRQKSPSTTQMNLQLMSFFTIVTFAVYQFLTLRSSYKLPTWEYDTDYKTQSHKIFQMLSENIMKTLVFLNIDIILQTLGNLATKFDFYKRFTLFSYCIVRCFPVGIILKNIRKKYDLFILLGEIFAITESIVLIILFISLSMHVDDTKAYMEEHRRVDRFSFEHILMVFKDSCRMISLGFSLEVAYRIIFLIISSNDRSRTLLFAKDFCNVIRIISFTAVLSGVIRLIFAEITEDDSNLVHLRSIFDANSEKNEEFFEYQDISELPEESEFALTEETVKKLI